MVTGDHPATAPAIAAEVGLSRRRRRRADGDDLPADEQVLGALLDRDGVVIARVAPEDKLRIARALQARGHVVAMTGDGVNDGPALHEADIGIAMGRSGTDVAREAADLVLLDDDFATIVAAIEQGRATFANIRRFLTYHLTDNVAELTPFVVWALSGGRFPLALGVLQILALDIGTDLLRARARRRAARTAPARRTAHPGRLLNRTVAAAAPSACSGRPRRCGRWPPSSSASWPPAGGPATLPDRAATWLAASGAAFIAVVLGQAANAFACRSATRWPGDSGWTTNRLLLGGDRRRTGVLARRPARAADRATSSARPPPRSWGGSWRSRPPASCWRSTRSTSSGVEGPDAGGPSTRERPSSEPRSARVRSSTYRAASSTTSTCGRPTGAPPVRVRAFRAVNEARLRRLASRRLW